MKTQKNTEGHAGQRRALFKQEMGALLTGHGFCFCEGRFLRLHAGQVLLQVALELDRGRDYLRFGAMPLCLADADPKLVFGESVADFMQAEDPCLAAQMDYFVQNLINDFVAIRDVAALLSYQERVLETSVGLCADHAFWACIQLEDYARAKDYAKRWIELENAQLERRHEEGFRKLEAGDYTRQERMNLKKNLQFRTECHRHRVYQVERMLHLMEIEVYSLLQDNVTMNIQAAEAAFHLAYPNYQ